jgi:hypothetical protein
LSVRQHGGGQQNAVEAEQAAEKTGSWGHGTLLLL